MTCDQPSACLTVYHWQYFTFDSRVTRGEHWSEE